MLQIGRGIAGIVTGMCFIVMGFLAYKAPSPPAALAGGLIGFLFAISGYEAIFKNSFTGGVATVGTSVIFVALLWYFPGFLSIVGSGIIGCICAIAILPVLSRK